MAKLRQHVNAPSGSDGRKHDFTRSVFTSKGSNIPTTKTYHCKYSATDRAGYLGGNSAIYVSSEVRGEGLQLL